MKKEVRYVYIAGPYTGGNVCRNMAKAMTAWHALVDMGFVPMCPHLSHFLDIQRQRPYEEWMQHDLAWIERCDAVLRLPGVSPGADREEEHAHLLGLPVYHSLEEMALLAYQKENEPC